MSEMQLTADHLVVLGKGRLIADAPLHELVTPSGAAAVRVRSPEAASLALLAERLRAAAAVVGEAGTGTLLVRDADIDGIRDLAHVLGVRLHELGVVEASLEEAFMELTGDSIEFGGSTRSVESNRPSRSGGSDGAAVDRGA